MNSQWNTSLPPHTPAQRSAFDPAIRARELFKFFQPSDFESEYVEGKSRVQDATLTAFAQLVTWRLDMRRCLISYFDEDKQYNAAEATKTLDIDDSTSAEDPADVLWQGTGKPSAVSEQNTICLNTLRAITHNGSFEVCDLREHPRFRTLPFVTGPPYNVYYYGTALKTRRGIGIGTIYVLDDKSHPPINQKQKRFLQTMANNVMRYLEQKREIAERRRGIKMNRHLNSFVNPAMDARPKGRVADLAKHKRTASSPGRRAVQPSSNTFTAETVGRRRMSTQSVSDAESVTSDASVASTATTTILQANDEVSKPKDDRSEHSKVFQKAANLLYRSLDLQEGGGVVFFDGRPPVVAGSASDSPRDTRRSSIHDARRNSLSNHSCAEILASSSTNKPDDDAVEFSGPSVDTLGEIVARYPQGKLWVFSSSGQVVSDSETEVPAPGDFKIQAEAAVLRQHFPEATQIMAIPLWNPKSSRWCVCFAFSTSMFRFFSAETDLLFCIAFCSCITIELARIVSLAADELKTNFISSISHELRSPLHGILASCEFLQDTEASAFQQSLVHTVESCAKTLLDTISMVLDYSKINAFERDWKRAAKSRKGALPAIPTGADGHSQAQPMLNIYGNVDLAAITEEVVESTTAGSVYQDLSKVEISEMDAKARGRNADRGHGKSGRNVTNPLGLPYAQHSTGQVEVILDLKFRNWTYVTQPGAFRRIVMNLVGNALKYTSQGWIKISLDAAPCQGHAIAANTTSNEQDGTTELVLLTIEDTGKGISPEYLKNKLFQPFAQEDHLSSGTGLGLSLVQSILKLLNGDIDVQSTLGRGTKITVTIPMIASGVGSVSSNTTPSTGSDHAKDDSVTAVHRLAKEKTIAVFRGLALHADKMRLNCSGVLHDKIAYYADAWCGLTVVPWSTNSRADLVMTDELQLPSYLDFADSKHTKSLKRPLLVLCSNATRPDLLQAYSEVEGIEFMSKPFGPYKLARALRLCFDRQHTPAQELGTFSEHNVIPTEGIEDVEHAVEEVTLSTKLGEINLLEAGSIIARADSSAADLALRSDHDGHATTSPSRSSKEGAEFPFVGPSSFEPYESDVHPITTEQMASPRMPSRPDLRNRRTMSPTVSELHKIERNVQIDSVLKSMTPAGVTATSHELRSSSSWLHKEQEDLAINNLTKAALNAASTKNQSSQAREPRLLIVDDNAINLRLLQTFMKKRKYKLVTSAKNGLEAVNAFEAALEGVNGAGPPDIVFMDISMPVMDGFEATRRIRALELRHSTNFTPTSTPPAALIIALTGLASGKDQSEAFLAGVDLYMTKPVSFKEVGRLLDNWESNAAKGVQDSVPHGPVTEWSAQVVAGLEKEGTEEEDTRL